MDLQNLEVLPLHRHPQYLKQCCDLINEEWPRSETARIVSLQASCDSLPTSLVLVNDKKQVLGHSKLTPIPSIPESCFIESVVINKALRGKKLGTFLMLQTESYCQNVLKLKMIHLSTKGQEFFYNKLGYEVCAPVSIYGNFLSRNPDLQKSESKANNKNVQKQSSILIAKEAPPPPPPPMPKYYGINNSSIKSNKTFMLKYLS